LEGIELKYSYEELAGMIDHSLLHPTMTDRELEEGCLLAAKYRVASACIKPYYVVRAAEILAGTGVAVGTVIGFPHGGSLTESKRYETELACKDGATEIDMVINIGKALSGDWEYVSSDIQAVVGEAHRHGAIVKVIFENDYMPDDAIKTRLCEVCEAAHAEYVKTSTGYGFVKGADGKYSYQGATEHDLKLMRAGCSPQVQIKAAGGVRDLDGLIRCRDLGCRRVGATATAAMMDEYRRRELLPGSEEAAAEVKLGTGAY
jgi:deoxyribose-phosphate aldolase